MREYRYNGSLLSLLVLTFATTTLSVSLLSKLLPVVSAKTFYFCQKVISDTFSTISYPIQMTLVIALILALSLGSLSFIIQIVKTKRLIKSFIHKRISHPSKVEKITTSLQLHDKVDVIEDVNCFSFCAGILRPRILITTSLISALTDRELESVFLHEKAHIQNHDPFKVLFGKTISWLFFFLPVFSEINKNMQATSEILADRFVTSFQRDDIYLRTALKKILLTPQTNFEFTPAIANPDYLEIRIRKLVNPSLGHGFRISWMSIGTSIVFLFFIVFLLQTPVSAFNTENSKEQTYFMCSSNNACSQECQKSSQTSNVSSPEKMFYSTQQGEKNFYIPSETTKSKPLKYN